MKNLPPPPQHPCPLKYFSKPMKQKNTPLVSALLFAVVSLACLFNRLPAMAATRTWNGGATPDGNWSNPGNWNGVAPGTNDLLVFSGSTQTATTNDYPTGMIFNNIQFNGGAAAFTIYGNSFTISEPTDAGSGNIANGSIISLASNPETIRAPFTLANGKHTVSSSGGGLLKLNGTVTRSNAAVAIMSGPINVTGGLGTNGSANGILGGWAICSNYWATIDASSNIIAYAAFTDYAANGIILSNSVANARIPNNTAATTASVGNSTTKINSLFFGSTTASSGNETISVGVGTNMILGQNGGIFNNTAVAGAGTYRTLIIGSSAGAGGTLTAGDGINPAQITLGSAPLPSASGFLTINSTITDNGSAPVTLVQAGAYVSANGSATGPTNTYSGGTYILQGRNSQPTEKTFGTGPVFIFPGGQANPGKATATGVNITNDFYIEGTGTVENNGMGVFRMFGSGGVTIGAVTTGTKLTGKITLLGNAAVCANGDVTGGIGIGGKITGPGGFALGSPTFATVTTGQGNNGAGGVLTIGDVGGLAIPNDYAGDTTINGSACAATFTANNVGATLKIFTAADNNIMPHGATGSYAGGKTGNLILNATLANNGNNSCVFDLNGSAQTINGLSSTAVNPTHDIITSSSAAGTLILGDSDATATYSGTLVDGSSLSLIKIGNGTETLSGANTYTGDTIVKAGRLVTTPSSTGGGNFSVSNNAALGVTLAAGGTTLPINGLTLANGSSVQLNTATFGNPTAALANVNGALNVTGNANISLSGVGLTAGGPFTVLTYNSGLRTGGGSFQLANSPRVVANLNDDNAGHVTMNIISADVAVKWEGGASGNWDINDNANTIWQTVPSATASYYIESGSGNDSVIFDDSATGNTNVTVTTAVTPASLAVTNSADTYTFTGPGKITGGTGLVKAGTGTLVIANTGNDFSGTLTLANGTLVISNDWNLPNTITGAGALVKSGSGTLTLSGDGSAYTGPVTVNGGILSVQTSASLATASSTTVTNGGSLDIGNNKVALAQEPITVSGSGVGGNGAIVNSGGYSGGAVATSFQKLTLAGNTTIGGPGRLDFRSTDVNAGTDATLSTSGQPYSLTKTTVSTLELAGVQVDAALADINIQGGSLEIHGNMTSLGNVANNVNVSGGATFQLDSLSGATPITKPVVMQDSGVFFNSAGNNTYGGPITLNGNSLFNVGGTAGASSLTLNGVVQGGGTLAKVTSASPLILATANNYSGGTVVNAGLIDFTADNNLGAVPGSPTPGNIVLNGGGISAQTDLTVNSNRGIAVGSGGGLFDVVSTMIYNGIIANNGASAGVLVKTNNGALFLGGTSTYTGNTIIAGGVLAMTNSGSINSSANIILLNSTTLDVSGHTGGSYTLAPGQTLTGSTYGTVNGNLTNGPGSTINPGTNAQGTYTIQGALVIQGTNLMDINKDQNFWDTLNATSIKYGGTLMLNLSNAVNPFVAGDAFPIYSASSYSGAFASIIPATPGAGLAWDTSTLTSDGTLRIMVGPTLPTTNANITQVTLSGTNVIVTGTNNNVPNTSFHYAVLTSTNLTLPLSNWTPVVTNSFNPDGTFNYTNPIVPGTPRQFIDVQAVP
jgi:fibronectin-binding autotransporter adhesin